ncbi:MAG TPA: O-antigen ligase family protein [Candidatus Limnocylindrales bacterium]|nr:O-antigen ligase family protein [Candidatus Limnocylindrales bacterium]
MPRNHSGKGKSQKILHGSSEKKSAKEILAIKSEKTVKTRLFAKNTALVIMLVVITALLFIGPFQRGLFFTGELLYAKAVLFGLLVIWGLFRLLTQKGSSSVPLSPLDCCLVVLLLAYAVSFFVAVNRRDALEEVLKIASYLVVYLVVWDVCRFWFVQLKKPPSEESSKIFLQAIPSGLNLILQLLVLATTVVTIASLGAAAGNWDFPGAFVWQRIASPMGYANTAAAYLMAAYLLALGLAPLAIKWLRPLYLVVATIMLLTVLLTFSRGAWLLLPPLMLLLALVAAPGEKLRSALYIISTSAVAIPMAIQADVLFRSETPSYAWIIVLVAAFAAAVLAVAVEFYIALNRKVKLTMAGAVVAVSVVVMLILIVLPGFTPLQLERTAEDREELQVIEQVIEDVAAGETYLLTLEVDARQDPAAVLDTSEFVWGLRVLSSVPDRGSVELLNYHGGATMGWEKKEFIFQVGQEAEQLRVQLYNQFSGTAVKARAVSLTAAGNEQRLHFILNRILPQRVYNRMFAEDRDINIDARFEFFRDALKVIRDYPIFGAGGGGWAALYQSYQERPYISSEVHNHFLQVWIEAGIFGFIAFIGLWVSLAIAFFRNCFKEKVTPQVHQFWAACFVPVAALGAHSVIDWNFSMGAVGIFLFALLGASRSLDSICWIKQIKLGSKQTQKQQQQGKYSWLVGGTGVVVGSLLFVFTIVLIMGFNSTRRSQELLNQDNFKQASIELRRAMQLDSFRAVNYHNLSVVNEVMMERTGNQDLVESTLDLARRAYELESFNPMYTVRYGTLLFHFVDVERGLVFIDRGINLRPFLADSYLHSAWARLSLAEFLLEKDRLDEAAYYLHEINSLKPLMQERLGSSEPLNFVLGRASFLLGDFEAAKTYFSAISEGDEHYQAAQSQLDAIGALPQAID